MSFDHFDERGRAVMVDVGGEGTDPPDGGGDCQDSS